MPSGRKRTADKTNKDEKEQKQKKDKKDQQDNKDNENKKDPNDNKSSGPPDCANEGEKVIINPGGKSSGSGQRTADTQPPADPPVTKPKAMAPEP